MRARGAAAVILCGLLLSSVSSRALAGQAAGAGCRRAVVFTLPGVTWADVERWRPPALLEAVEMGAAGSMSVRTISSRTSYASGFASIGAGSRLDAGFVPGTTTGVGSGGRGVVAGLRAGGLEELLARAKLAGYGGRPGAWGEAVAPRVVVAVGNGDPGRPFPTPARAGRWTLYAAMDERGVVARSAVSPGLLEKAPAAPFGVRSDPGSMRAAVKGALGVPCASVVIDQGDLTRADRLAWTTGRAVAGDRERALEAADRLLGHLLERLDPARDLLLILSPTSPAWAGEAHLGVAVAVGPGYPSGSSLESASTRRPGLVTLPDVAPTALRHSGHDQPPAMNGTPWTAVGAVSPDRLRAAVELDAESVFIESVKAEISSAYVVFQVLLYLGAVGLLGWRERAAGKEGRDAGEQGGGDRDGPLESGLELAALAVVGFFVATYLAGLVDGHVLGRTGYWLLLAAVDAALVAAAVVFIRGPLDRLLGLAALTTAVTAVDLSLGAPLQFNTVFGYTPIIAGRFAGLGNTGFAALGATALLTGALIVHRRDGGAGALWAAALLFIGVVVLDGAPQLGSDVGGVIALVPGLGISWVLLSGRRPGVRLVALTAVGAMVFLAAFLALDLARPPQSQTHLARLFLDVRDRGLIVLLDTVQRKAEANLRVFRTTIYTYFVPPALVALAWLLGRPRGRWHRLAVAAPRLRAGLIGGLVLSLLGFVLNDSGIVIPAVILSFLVPMAIMVHLHVERQEPV
ncbi:MAG: hypothetical protein M3333_05545 [Actinomycetota bacterium]|nr:hypothetical protein [Actinomycetota bacterium]